MPALTLRILEDPAPFVAPLVEQMREYWKVAIEPYWPRIRSLHEADVTYRARQLALGGAELLFADLHPSLSWSGDTLVIDKHHWEEISPNGRGLVLIPAVFDWPGIAILMGHDLQPTISYSPRGIAELWDEPEDAKGDGAMDDLIGGTRADILRVLRVPMTTGELATGCISRPRPSRSSSACCDAPASSTRAAKAARSTRSSPRAGAACSTCSAEAPGGRVGVQALESVTEPRRTLARSHRLGA